MIYIELLMALAAVFCPYFLLSKDRSAVDKKDQK